MSRPRPPRRCSTPDARGGGADRNVARRRRSPPGSGNALGLLLGVWPLAATVACLPGEYGPNLAQFAAHGFGAHPLPVDDLGRVDVDAAAPRCAPTPGWCT